MERQWYDCTFCIKLKRCTTYPNGFALFRQISEATSPNDRIFTSITHFQLHNLHSEDEKLEQKSFPIVIAYNGIHHYVPTVYSVPLLKDGLDEVLGLLTKTSLVYCDVLQSSKNKKFDDLLQQCMQDVRHLQYKTENLSALLMEDKFVKKSKTVVELDTRKKDSPLTKAHCECGLLIGLRKEKKDAHVSAAHDNDNGNN